MFDFITPGLGSAISGLVGAGASIFGGMQGAQGQAATNAQSMMMAQQQQNFQENMSSTAYQRGMSDMKAAGLNPILAANLGGATSPTGSMPTLGNPGAFMGQGIASAGQAAATMANVKTQLTQAQKDNSQTKLNDASTVATGAQTDLTNAGVDRTKQETITSAANADAARASANASNTQAANNSITSQILQHNVNSAKAESQLKQLEADAAAKMGPGGWGQLLTTIQRGFNSMTGGTKSDGPPSTNPSGSLTGKGSHFWPWN